MQKTATTKSRSKLQLILIALLFAGPLLLAALMYGSRQWQPQGATNSGEVLQPIINLGDALPDSAVLTDLADRWLLIYPNSGVCDETCEAALHRLRQTRLMLGNKMTRVSRIFLHGESPPDRVLLREHHAGLNTIKDQSLMRLLAERQPANQANGGIFLVDPLGNLIMYFSPDLDPGDMVDDIKHLLELSRIG